MRRLSAEDLSRIIHGGEGFLLLDVRSSGDLLPGAVRVPFGTPKFASDVLVHAISMARPVVVYGEGHGCPIAQQAAEHLSVMGFAEVWTYSGDPAAWSADEPTAQASQPFVLADPDVAFSTH
jgi:3-mercaptopyruvate sulfurtransferase SseA